MPQHHQGRDQASVQPRRPRHHRKVRGTLPPRYEHHLAARRDRAQPRRRLRPCHHAHHLRLQLPRRDLRLLRHAHQRQSRHGLLRPRRQTHRPQQRPDHHPRPAQQVPRSPRSRRRPLRPLRKPQEGQSLGPHRRHVRPRSRAQTSSSDSRTALPALQLHLLHHLHGGLPPVQRRHRLRRRRHHRPGQALQHGPLRLPSSKKNASAPWPETAASRNAASHKTASRPAPNSSPSPKPSATWAATSSSNKSKTSSRDRIPGWPNLPGSLAFLRSLVRFWI